MTVSAKDKKVRTLRTARNTWQLWVMVAPAIIILIIFNYVPMYGVQLAFRKFSFKLGLTGGEWVGLTYFKQFFSSSLCSTTIINTLRIAIASILFGFPAPILLALLFNQIARERFKKVMQTVVYLPHFISTVVMVSMLMILLSPNRGLIGRVLSQFGITNGLMGSSDTFVGVYVGSDIWQHCGWSSIIYMAALSSIDTALYDAAKVDGVNRLQMVWYIDIPSILPTIMILFILQMGHVLNVGFEKVYLMQNDLNLSVSEVISTYVYKIGLVQSQFSFSAAVNLFNTLINFLFIILTNTVVKKLSDISLF